MNGGRTLIFIVAYECSVTSLRCYRAFPPSTLMRRGSTSWSSTMAHPIAARTSAIGSWVQEHDCRNLTVLRNPVNQGYGGIEKLGYRIAIDADTTS